MVVVAAVVVVVVVVVLVVVVRREASRVGYVCVSVHPVMLLLWNVCCSRLSPGQPMSRISRHAGIYIRIQLSIVNHTYCTPVHIYTDCDNY